MMPATSKPPPEHKRLSRWDPFVVPEKIRTWLTDNRYTDRLVPDETAGGYRHEQKVAGDKGRVWAEAGHYDSQVDFALSMGIVSAGEAAAHRTGGRTDG